jgi:hypothetical protein
MDRFHFFLSVFLSLCLSVCLSFCLSDCVSDLIWYQLKRLPNRTNISSIKTHNSGLDGRMHILGQFLLTWISTATCKEWKTKIFFRRNLIANLTLLFVCLSVCLFVSQSDCKFNTSCAAIIFLRDDHLIDGMLFDRKAFDRKPLDWKQFDQKWFDKKNLWTKNHLIKKNLDQKQ